MNQPNVVRLRAAVAVAVIVPVGIFAKLYTGPLDHWVNDSLGGVFYEVFWCLLGLIVFIRARPATIAAIVFAITCLLEFLQLWHPPVLELLRSSFVGVTVLGSHFSWWDFPYYVVGSLLGWALLLAIGRKRVKPGR